MKLQEWRKGGDGTAEAVWVRFGRMWLAGDAVGSWERMFKELTKRRVRGER